jgi:hypothetical protein
VAKVAAASPVLQAIQVPAARIREEGQKRYVIRLRLEVFEEMEVLKRSLLKIDRAIG